LLNTDKRDKNGRNMNKKPPKKTNNRQKIGQIGENIASRFLMKQGFEILDRNYWKKWGEIDIVAQKGGFIHFIEVKTVSHPLRDVSYETYRPEENVHPWKRKRLARVIQTYLLNKKVSDDIEWVIDIMAVFLDLPNKKAKIRITKDIIL